MYKTLSLIICFICMSILGCSRKKDITRDSTLTSVDYSVSSAPCTGLSEHITLKPVSYDIGQLIYPQARLPMDYKAYVIDQNHLSELMNNIKKGLIIHINFPVNNQCYTFQLKNSGTISPELNKKYPETMSYRGFSNNNNSADVDFDGQYLKVRITTQMGIYMFEPFETEKGVFYLSYLLRDSGYPKSKVK